MTERAGVVLRPEMTPREAAIAIVEDSRRTHFDWASWLAAYPDDDRASALGDELWHRECIENYDLVLEVLRSAEDGDAT